MKCLWFSEYRAIISGLVLLLILSISGASYSADKPIELSFATSLQAQNPFAQALEGWGKEIEKRTEARVKVTYFHAGTLADAGSSYDAIINGICDIALTWPSYNRGRFPLIEVLDLPGYDFNALELTRVQNEWYQKFKPKELDDTHVLYMFASTAGTIYGSKPMRNLKDMKGTRIRCVGMSCNIVELLGATPVAMPKSDVYDALQKGTVDGAIGWPNELKNYRMAEVTKYTTAYGKVGSTSVTVIAMNKQKWEALTPDLKRIVTQVSQEWQDYMGNAMNAIELEGYQYAKGKGHTFLTLLPEEAQRWKKAVEPIAQDYVKRASAKGLPAKEALAYRNELVAKYSKVYKSIFPFE